MKPVSSSDVMTADSELFMSASRVFSALNELTHQMHADLLKEVDIRTAENFLNYTTLKSQYDNLNSKYENLNSELEDNKAELDALKADLTNTKLMLNNCQERIVEIEKCLNQSSGAPGEQSAHTQPVDNHPQQLTEGEANLAELFTGCEKEKRPAVMKILHTYLDNCSGSKGMVNKIIRTVLLAAHNELVDKAEFPQGIPMDAWVKAFPGCKDLTKQTFNNTKNELYDKTHSTHKKIINSDLYSEITEELYKYL